MIFTSTSTVTYESIFQYLLEHLALIGGNAVPTGAKPNILFYMFHILFLVLSCKFTADVVCASLIGQANTCPMGTRTTYIGLVWQEVY